MNHGIANSDQKADQLQEKHLYNLLFAGRISLKEYLQQVNSLKGQKMAA